MVKTTVKIGGMACGMCESHINDVIRKTFPDAKKVASSHKKGISSFVTEDAVDPSKLEEAVEATGYHYLGVVSQEPYQKHGLFG